MSLHNDDIDRLVTTYRDDFTPDVEQGLERLHRNIAVVRPLTPRRRSLTVRTWSIAATVAVVLSVAAVLLFGGDGRTYLRNTDQPLAAFTLPDGTQLTLQQYAELSYDPDAYNTANRQVSLSGQAYFEVRPDANRPFLVHNGSTELRVTGTAFNLRTAGEIMEVEVSEGTVVLSRDGQDIEVAVKECGTARNGLPLVHRPAPNLNHHAWRTGQLKFDHTPIAEVLGYFYDNWSITCEWADGQACDYTVSGSYSGGDAGKVLADIAQLGGATLTPLDATGKHFSLSGPCTE